jgi:hypothetical protein
MSPAKKVNAEAIKRARYPCMIQNRAHHGTLCPGLLLFEGKRINKNDISNF